MTLTINKLEKRQLYTDTNTADMNKVTRRKGSYNVVYVIVDIYKC